MRLQSGKMIERIVESFFSKVGDQLVDYSHNTMRSIKDFKSALDSMQRKLKSLSAKYQILRSKSRMQSYRNEVQSRGFISRFLGGDRAAKLNEKVDEIVEQSRHFCELVLDVYETRGEALLTSRLVGEAFEKNLERIWELLVTDNKVSSIGIYGMGGVGKTTLAKHIHNQLLEKTQDCVFWVTISHEFSITMLQDKIAHVVGLNLADEQNEDKRATRLNRAFSLRKNIVLILDGVEKYQFGKGGRSASCGGL
ncbi:hypothetical protein Pfo_020499 [Paulownia fortunei]|nr:hypothetical protein Pfo_020499 [Paulownia fortunei]